MPNFDETIATLEGQTLYELYLVKCIERLWTVSRPVGMVEVHEPGPFVAGKKWKDLTPTQKGFWQTLAQDFLKAAS